MASQSKLIPPWLAEASATRPPPPPTYCWKCKKDTNDWNTPEISRSGQNPGKWGYKCRTCYRPTYPLQTTSQGLQEAINADIRQRAEAVISRMELELANKMEREEEAKKAWESALWAQAAFEPEQRSNGELTKSDEENLKKLQSAVDDKRAKFLDRLRIANTFRSQLENKRKEAGWPEDLDFPLTSQGSAADGSRLVAASRAPGASLTPTGTPAKKSAHFVGTHAALPSSSSNERKQARQSSLPYLESDSGPDSSPTPGARDLSKRGDESSTSTNAAAAVSSLRAKGMFRMTSGSKLPRAMRKQSSKVLEALDKSGNRGLQMTVEGKAGKEASSSSPLESSFEASSSPSLTHAQEAVRSERSVSEQAKALTSTPDRAMSTFIGNAFHMDAEMDDLEDLYYPNVDDVAMMLASGPSQAARDQAAGQPAEKDVEKPPRVDDSVEAIQGGRYRDSFLDHIREVLGKKTPDFKRSSSLDSDEARILKRKDSDADVNDDKPDKRRRNENGEDERGNESKDDEHHNDDKGDEGDNERDKSSQDGDGINEHGGPGTSANPIVVDDIQKVWIVYWSKSWTEPYVYCIMTWVPLAFGFYDLLLDSLGLGRDNTNERRREVWNWRKHTWHLVDREEVLPTENDTLIMVRKPGVGFCSHFEVCSMLRGIGEHVPQDVQDRAQVLIAE